MLLFYRQARVRGDVYIFYTSEMASRKTTKKAVSNTSRGAVRPPKSGPSHTTVRIDLATHGLLMKMSEETGKSLGHVISEAAAELEQRMFMRRLNEDYRRMRSNPEEWAGFVRERDEWLLGVPILREDNDA
jgi:hypothetical protein